MSDPPSYPIAAYLALTRADLRLAVSYRPPAPPVRLSAFSQVAFFAISDYALPGCRAPQPMATRGPFRTPLQNYS